MVYVMALGAALVAAVVGVTLDHRTAPRPIRGRRARYVLQNLLPLRSMLIKVFHAYCPADSDGAFSLRVMIRIAFTSSTQRSRNKDIISLTSRQT